MTSATIMIASARQLLLEIARLLLVGPVVGHCLPKWDDTAASVAERENAAVVITAPLTCAGLLRADGVPAALLAARLDLHGLVVEGVAALLLRLRLAVVHQTHAGTVDDVVLVVHALIHLQRRNKSLRTSSEQCTFAWMRHQQACAQAGGMQLGTQSDRALQASHTSTERVDTTDNSEPMQANACHQPGW